MADFTTLVSRIVPLLADDVDTDQIIPARFLKVTDKAGLGAHLFDGWRYGPDGAPRPDFVLNAPECRGAQVLLAGENFGCGSSREHAPWALLGWGFRAVIARSFADIFRNNALKNGLLPVALAPAAYARLVAGRAIDPASTVAIDLASQSVTLPDGSHAEFPIDPFARRCLLRGVDELGYLQSFAAEVERYESARE